MAYYLVTAKLKETEGKLYETLVQELQNRSYLPIKPFGIEITKALTKARIRPDGIATWEEEDYCNPPLREEKLAVLDKYFEDIEVRDIGKKGNGWEEILDLPRLLPQVDIYIDPNEEESFGI